MKENNNRPDCSSSLIGPIGHGGGVYTPPCPDQVLENVIENVLLFLTCRHDRNSASLVCKSWYRAEAQTRSDLFIGNCYAVDPVRTTQRFKKVRSVLIKGKPRFADFGLTPPGWGARTTPWISAFALAYPSLEKIHLKRICISNSDLELISKAFTSLKDLTLVCCENFGSNGLAFVASNCRHLRVLDLIDDEVKDNEVDWISCFPRTGTCLESLSFECLFFEINFEALEKLLIRSPNFKRLRVNRFISIDQLHRLMALAPQLTHLGTGSFSPPEVWVPAEQDLDYRAAFAACKSLVYLSGFRDVVPIYLPAIHPVCANLTTLNFSYANMNAEELRSVIFHCHKLQIFWVLDTVGDEGLQAVSSTCKDLRELRVFPIDTREDSEGFVSEVGLLSISEGCRKLQSILYFCQMMTNAAVIAMSKNCPDLVVFRLCIMGRHRPDHMTDEPMDEGFGAIVMNCKKLTRLAVSGLLTDKAFKYIGQYGKLVRTLSVAFAGDTDMALKYVLEGCPKLLKLEVRDSPFGDSVLRAGLHHFYNMRFLWMSACRLTLPACREIARELPNLVVEVFTSEGEPVDENNEFVDTLYMYRSLAGPRTDAADYVRIL